MRQFPREALNNELQAARQRQAAGDLSAAFHHLERAHILGQRSTRAHVRVHWEMLRIGRLRGDRREIVGQISRLVAAALFSRIWVPEGNTGGADVSAFRSMPISPDLLRLLKG
jgi:hypothetical protein